MEPNRFPFGAPASNNPLVQDPSAFNPQWPGQGASPTGPRTVTTPDNNFPDPTRDRWQTGVRSGHSTHGRVTPNSVRSLIALPQSIFPPEQRFHLLLLGYASDSGWLEINYSAMMRVSLGILTGSIPPALTLTSDQALGVINAVIQWNRTIRENPTWAPAEVRGIFMEQCTPFRTTLQDPTFSKLLCDQLGQVPSTFFAHVRMSIKRLMTPAQFQPDPTRLWPQHQIPGYLPEASTHVSWVRSRLEWDDRWGYNLWHVLVNETSEFQVWWFADRAVREVVLHTLRLSNSVGSFSVLDYDEVSNVPCTIQTLSFVLAALTVELEEVARYASCEGIADYVARFEVVQRDILCLLTSINERNNGRLDQHQSNAAYQGLQSFLQLAHVDNIIPAAGAVATTISIT